LQFVQIQNSALEVFYENALYKFTFDIDIDKIPVRWCSSQQNSLQRSYYKTNKLINAWLLIITSAI